jgi:hypothetical protein
MIATSRCRSVVLSLGLVDDLHRIDGSVDPLSALVHHCKRAAAKLLLFDVVELPELDGWLA